MSRQERHILCVLRSVQLSSVGLVFGCFDGQTMGIREGIWIDWVPLTTAHTNGASGFLVLLKVPCLISVRIRHDKSTAPIHQ